MQTKQKIIAEKLFKLKVLTSKGTVFQGLFEEVMTCFEEDFKKVRAYGNDGDKKNDGFIPSKGIYYQVYAPKDPKLKDADAEKKLSEDFPGLLNYWQGDFNVSEYYFVFNDEYFGSAPMLYKKAAELQKQNPDIKVSILMCEDLNRIFCNLDEIGIQKVIGFIPDPEDLDLLDLDVLTEVVGHLLLDNHVFSYESSLVVPDFTDKIEFNNLSTTVGGLLNQGSYQMFALEQYFENKPDQQDILQNVFTRYYTESVDELEGSHNDRSDLVFFRILQKACGNTQRSKQVQDAIIVLMSLYFESCDIFEEPS